MKPTEKCKFWSLCYKLWCGFRRRPMQILLLTVAAFSTIMALVEGVSRLCRNLFPCLKTEDSCVFQDPYVYMSMILLSVAFGLYQSWAFSKIVIKVPMTGTKIEVLFGDLFDQNGLRGIGATEFFESEIGVPVAKGSLLGKLLIKDFIGEFEEFDKQLEKQLKGCAQDIEHTYYEAEKPVGKKEKFPIGTTALIKFGNDKYIIFANARTVLKTCKAESDVKTMWMAMCGLWEGARNKAGGVPLNVPLIGDGISGVGLPPRDLLNLIILSAITATKVKKITSVIRIILHPSQFKEIDLRAVKQYWNE